MMSSNLIPSSRGLAGVDDADEVSGVNTPLHGPMWCSVHPATRMTPNYHGSHQITAYAGAQGA